MEDFAQFYAAHRAALAKANERNKTVLFDALASFGIRRVVVQFDGEGDSGQINSVDTLLQRS